MSGPSDRASSAASWGCQRPWGLLQMDRPPRERAENRRRERSAKPTPIVLTRSYFVAGLFCEGFRKCCASRTEGRSANTHKKVAFWHLRNISVDVRPLHATIGPVPE